MRDIKERVRDKNPKIRNPATRLPKELVRSAVLKAKEKPRELHEKRSGQSDSPTQYGTEKIESVQYRAASVAGRTIGKTTYRGGKKLAGVTYRKIKERKSRQEEAKAAEEAMEQGAEEILKGGLANFDVESYKGYKSKFNDIYREEAYALLNVIIEMLG